MKKNYEKLLIKILALPEDIITGSPIDSNRENIGEWNDDFLQGGQSK